MIGISNSRLFARLCTALGCENWTKDPRFATNASRVRHRADLEGPIADLLRTRPTAHWLELLNRHDVPSDAVQNAEQVMDDPQLAALNQLAEVMLDGHESAKIPRLPVGLSLTPPALAGPPPKLGEHGRAILIEAGYSGSEIEEFVRSGACAFGG